MDFNIQDSILMALVIVLAASVFVGLFLLILRNKRLKNKYDAAIKIVVLLYFAWVFFRYMLSDSFVLIINGGLDSIKIETSDILQSIIRWGHYTSYVVLPMAVFFKSKLFRKIAVYFCLPFAVFSSVFFEGFIKYFMAATESNSIVGSIEFRRFYLAFELILAIAIPLIIIIKHHKSLVFASKREVGQFFVSLFFVSIALIPVYTPQFILGYTSIDMGMFTLGNIIWIAVTIAEVAVLYRIFRFRNYRDRYMLCVFLSLALFMHFNSMFLMGFTLNQLPLQICSLGVYFFVLALIIKKRSFFNFTFLVNVVGTMIAILMPYYSGGFAGFWNFHYIIEHMQVFVIPLLCMLLRIFPRLGKKALKHLCIGFSVYFFICFVIGTILNGFADLHGQGPVNFFFIFDIQEAIKWVPLVRSLTQFEWTIGRFKIYPVFQIVVYLGFLALCVILYLIIIKLYDILDDHFELRRARIALYEKKTGKTYTGHKEYPDDTESDKNFGFFFFKKQVESPSEKQ